MFELPIIRAAYLNLIVDELRDSGEYDESGLQQLRLPVRLADKPDAYVPLRQTLAFMEWTILSTGIDDAVLRAGFRLNVSDFSAELRQALLASHCLDDALDSFCGLAARELSWARYRIVRKADHVRVYSSLDGSSQPRSNFCLEWLLVIPLLAIFRHFAGKRWGPASIEFRTPHAPADKIRHRYRGTGLLVGQQQTSIMFQSPELDCAPNSLNRHSPISAGKRPTSGAPESSGWDFPACLVAVLLPYLEDGSPNIKLAAAIVGCGVRTLQRQLRHFGVSYTEILQIARLDAASQLLREPGVKVIDVANAVGFGDPSHFSRAFRRATGTSPTQFRMTHFEGALTNGALTPHGTGIAGIQPALSS